MPHWALAPFLLLALLAHATPVLGGNKTEAAALLQIRAGFANGPSVLTNWNASSPGAPCDWAGITCPAGQVDTVDLGGMGLKGTIPPAGWDKLASLQQLLLRNNSLSGPIPSEWSLPRFLKNLTLSANALKGPLPARLWARIPSLRQLQLDQNSLSGKLVNLTLPQSLEYLELGVNQLTGSLPNKQLLSSLKYLTYLGLANNSLNGTMPADWALPSSLVTLWLSNNRLSGTLPATLLLPAQLESLLLNGNRFAGTMPAWKLPKTLKTLDLSSCRLMGTLPPSWQLPSSNLYLYNNSLSGTLPPWKLPSTLWQLALHMNKLEGTLPVAWAPLPASMFGIYLNNNSLTGTLPPEWLPPKGTSDAGVELLLQNNPGLGGSLPANWTLSPNHDLYVGLWGCNFTGNLPAWTVRGNVKVLVMPQGGPGFCGQVPTSTVSYYYTYNGNSLKPTLLSTNALSTCNVTIVHPQPPPPISGGSSSSSTGVIVGVLFGCLAAVAAGIAVWWLRRRRRHKAISVLKSEEKPISYTPRLGSATKELSSPFSSKPPSWLQKIKTVAAIASRGSAGPQTPSSGALPARAAASTSSLGGGVSSAEHSELSQDQVLQLALRAASEEQISSRKLSSKSSLGESLKMWEIDYNSLELTKQIGEGSFGRVYLARWHELLVAVKILLSTSAAQGASGEEAVQQAITLSNPVLENLHKEAGLMASLRHPNIVGFLGVCPSPPCVVTEYCGRGSLTDVLKSASTNSAVEAKLDWVLRLHMMMDTAKGMLYLHAHNPPVIHRDLKSPNLLVDTHWRVKISDFNLSKILEDTSLLSSAQATNPRWLAPEVLAGKPATMASDVFSFGVILWEMITWTVPFADENHWQLVRYVAEGGRLEFPERDQMPGKSTGAWVGLDDYIALVQQCWAQAPEERPTFGQIVESLRDLMASATRQKAGQASRRPGNSGQSPLETQVL